MSAAKTLEVDPGKCVLCAEDGSKKVVKDKGFIAMMNLLWSSVDVDIKPAEIEKLDLCEPCFNKTLNLYDMDDTCIGIEKRIQKLTKTLLKKSVQGARKLTEDNLPRLDVQEKIFEQFGEIILNAAESDEGETGYDIQIDVEQPGPRGTPRRGRKPLAAAGFTSNTRKSLESSEADQSKSESGSPEEQQPTKRPRRQAATRGRKRVKEDSSEDEEDVYSGEDDEEDEGSKEKGKDEKDDEDFSGSGSGSESEQESSEAEAESESP